MVSGNRQALHQCPTDLLQNVLPVSSMTGSTNMLQQMVQLRASSTSRQEDEDGRALGRAPPPPLLSSVLRLAPLQLSSASIQEPLGCLLLPPLLPLAPAAPLALASALVPAPLASGCMLASEPLRAVARIVIKEVAAAGEPTGLGDWER